MSKTLSERLSEMVEIYRQLDEFGINEHVCQEIQKFKSAANRFVKEGQSQSGRIVLEEIGRDLVYVLSTQPHIVSNVRLKTI